MTKKEYRGIITGMILGDGNLQKRGNYINPVIRINHSSKQREYLKHKIYLLQGMFHYDLMKSYREKEVLNPNGKAYKICTFHSRVSPKLKTLYKIFYGSGEKKITRKALNFLTPHGIAIWYMDDGCYTKQRKTVMISTYTSKEENEEIIKYFKERYGIEWRLGKHKDKYFIQRGAKSEDMEKFMKLIRKYVIPQMRYKLTNTVNTSFN